MSAENAPIPVIEHVWVVEATYAPDGAETRVPVRAEHLARVARLKGDGVVVEAGAYLDVSTSLFILRAATEEEALAILRADPYIREGVWVELRARPFGRVMLTDADGPIL